jgi:hypothetical protein
VIRHASIISLGGVTAARCWCHLVA